MRIVVATALAFSLASWGAAAQQIEPSLVPGHQGDVRFVSGGVGLDDRASLRGIEDAYNLRLTFAVQPSGEYLADVNVKLVDADGKPVLDTVADGPLFFAHVPPGRYRVTVTNGDEAQSREVAVAGTGAASQAFYWRQAG